MGYGQASGTQKMPARGMTTVARMRPPAIAVSISIDTRSWSECTRTAPSTLRCGRSACHGDAQLGDTGRPRKCSSDEPHCKAQKPHNTMEVVRITGRQGGLQRRSTILVCTEIVQTKVQTKMVCITGHGSQVCKAHRAGHISTFSGPQLGQSLLRKRFWTGSRKPVQFGIGRPICQNQIFSDSAPCGKVQVTWILLAKLYNHYDLSQSFPCATPRELQGVRRCAAAGRAGGWQLRTGLAESGGDA